MSPVSDENVRVDVSVVEHPEEPDPWKRFSILSKPSYTRCHCNTRTDADIIAEALRRYEQDMRDSYERH